MSAKNSLKLSNLKKEISEKVTVDYKGAWASVQLEPIPYSGERINIAIASVGYDGQYRVSPIFKPSTLKALFGKKTKSIQSAIEAEIEHITEQIGNGNDLDHCKMMFKNFNLGEVNEALSDSFDGIIEQAVISSTALSEPAASISDDEAVENVNRRWSNQIKNAIKASRPDYKQYMNKKTSIRNKEVSFDFIKMRIIANFAAIPLSNSADISIARSKLMDLDNFLKDESSDKSNHHASSCGHSIP